MPQCEFCGYSEDHVYKCKKCGIKFCEECGSETDELCLFCLEIQRERDVNSYNLPYAE